MYTLVHMMLVVLASASRGMPCVPAGPPPPPHPLPHRPDDHRESELASDNRVRFAPIELLTAVRNATRDTAPRPRMKIIIAF